MAIPYPYDPYGEDVVDPNESPWERVQRRLIEGRRLRLPAREFAGPPAPRPGLVEEQPPEIADSAIPAQPPTGMVPRLPGRPPGPAYEAYQREIGVPPPAEPNPNIWRRLLAGAVGGYAGAVNAGRRPGMPGIHPESVSAATSNILGETSYRRKLGERQRRLGELKSGAQAELDQDQMADTARRTEAQIMADEARAASERAQQSRAEQAMNEPLLSPPGYERIDRRTGQVLGQTPYRPVNSNRPFESVQEAKEFITTVLGFQEGSLPYQMAMAKAVAGVSMGSLLKEYAPSYRNQPEGTSIQQITPSVSGGAASVTEVKPARPKTPTPRVTTPSTPKQQADAKAMERANQLRAAAGGDLDKAIAAAAGEDVAVLNILNNAKRSARLAQGSNTSGDMAARFNAIAGKLGGGGAKPAAPAPAPAPAAAPPKELVEFAKDKPAGRKFRDKTTGKMWQKQADGSFREVPK